MSQSEQHSSPGISVNGEHPIDLPGYARVGKRARVAAIVVALVLGVGATRTIVSNAMDAVNARHLASLTKPQRLASEREEVQIHGQQPATVVYLARVPGGACRAGPCREAPSGAARRGG
ncbi:hypothetical protein LMG28688_04559 [Paraburkholderia caffeinitolerans]|uniref:Uncharacterized protein n=1 Tax=Paraburkholderia caffeinitolerans TaxID=1723730 RepID=A0A6J5GEV6_9BURK|nr:hypothetical protein [Paraburkholderia caffeinitolerans]CAB3797597.1 hypothetical protein LMG28688_04559 [Paraburkholderia caffeinitolerans]